MILAMASRSRILPLMTVRILPAIAAILTVLAGMNLPASAANALSCAVVPKIASVMLHRHVLLHTIDQEMRERIADIYTKRIDPSRILFLDSEATRIRKQVVTVLTRVVRNDCTGLDRLHEIRRDRIGYLEDYARRELSREDWKLDPDAEFVIDPEIRGYPKTPEERDALYSNLFQFRIARILNTSTDTKEAKRRVIHQFELLARRVRELETGDVYTALLDSIAKALDPHSSYLSNKQLEDFAIRSTLALEGIGAQLRSRDGYTFIERVIPGAPADRQGQLRQQDRIVAVAQDGEAPVDVIDWALRDVAQMIRGKKGTKVHLTVLREGEKVQTLQITIVRDKIDLKQRAAKLRYHTVEREDEKLKLAVIELPSFYGNSRDVDGRQSDGDVARLLREAQEQGARGVLLDLSRNAGGLLDQAVKVAGLFMDEGTVVQVRDPQSGDRILRDDDGLITWKGPLAVLTSRRSASASEIVGATLQDYARAVIVGDGKTHGKGTVQTVSRLRKGFGAVKVTTGFFFRPNGRSIQNLGVASDVAIPAAFNTDKMGEDKRPYTLPNRTIEPAPGFAGDASARPWKTVTSERIKQLVQRSKPRVAANKLFVKLTKSIETQRAQAKKGIARISELLSGDKKSSQKSAAEANGKDAKTDTKAAGEAEKKLSILHLEALEVLADHVLLGG